MAGSGNKLFTFKMKISNPEAVESLIEARQELEDVQGIMDDPSRLVRIRDKLDVAIDGLTGSEPNEI